MGAAESSGKGTARARRTPGSGTSGRRPTLLLLDLPEGLLVAVVAHLPGADIGRLARCCRTFDAALIRSAVHQAATHVGRAIPEAPPPAQVYDWSKMGYVPRASSWPEWLNGFDDLWTEASSWPVDELNAAKALLAGKIYESILVENPPGCGTVPAYGSEFGDEQARVCGLGLALDGNGEGRLLARGVEDDSFQNNPGRRVRCVTSVRLDLHTPSGRIGRQLPGRQLCIREDSSLAPLQGDALAGEDNDELLESLCIGRPIELTVRRCKPGVKFKFDDLCTCEKGLAQYTQDGDILLMAPTFDWLGPYLLRLTPDSCPKFTS